jgi:hypothetical protein
MGFKHKNQREKGGTESEARYRPRRYSSTPPTIGGTVPSGLVSQKKRKILKEKEVARRTKTQKIKKSNKQELLQKKTIIAGEVTSRPITQTRTKKNVLPETTRWLRENKTKNYHPGLDRYEAVDVSGDLDVPRGLPRAHGGRRNPGVEFDSALRGLVFHEPSVEDP